MQSSTRERGQRAPVGVASAEKLNNSSSPDGSKYPFGLGFNPKDIADSGSELDEKTSTSAPKNKKTAKRCHFAVLNICSCTSHKKARGSN
jgi:hypothetical protein